MYKCLGSGVTQIYNLKDICEGYHLEDGGNISYTNKIYIPNFVYLRRIGMDEIHNIPLF